MTFGGWIRPPCPPTLARSRHRTPAMTLRPLLLALAVTAALAACERPTTDATNATGATAQSAEDRAKQLDTLYAEHWEEVLKLNPIQATFQGDHRYDDQLPDFGSAEFRRQQHDFTVRWLDRVRAVGSDGLSGQDLLSYEIFVRNGEMALEDEKFPGWMMPVNQMGSIASYAVLLG